MTDSALRGRTRTLIRMVQVHLRNDGDGIGLIVVNLDMGFSGAEEWKEAGLACYRVGHQGGRFL